MEAFTIQSIAPKKTVIIRINVIPRKKVMIFFVFSEFRVKKVFRTGKMAARSSIKKSSDFGAQRFGLL